MVYVGKSVNIAKRFREHKRLLNLKSHHNSHLQKSWDKYGADAFSFKIVEICDKDKLNDLEIHYISLYSKLGNIYNMTDGGDGALGTKKSNHTKSLIGSKNSRKVVLLNTREVFDSCTKAALRFNLTPSAISLTCNGKTKSAGRVNGVALTWATYDEYIAMSDEEISNRISQAQIGLKYDLSTVVLLNTKERFKSISEATQKYHILNISACCRHIRKSSGMLNNERLVWMYADEYDTLSDEQIHDVICSAQN